MERLQIFLVPPVEGGLGGSGASTFGALGPLPLLPLMPLAPAAPPAYNKKHYLVEKQCSALYFIF